MKATDLMIGDWVQNTNGDRGKFSAMIHFADNNTCEFVIKYGENGICYSDPSLIKPIPITPELVEKNGLKRVGKDIREDAYWRFENDVCIIEILKDGKMNIWLDKGALPDFSLPIPYSVDQLQHELRVVGLDDMANNLKV